MSPSFIVAIVAILLVGWIVFFKLTPEFRRNLTAEQSREVADHAKLKVARRHVRREWVNVIQKIREASANGETQLTFSGGLTDENEKRLTDMGYTIIGWSISWTKRTD